MKKLTIDTSKLTDHQTSLLMDLFCDVVGGQEMADITNVPHMFTLTVEEVGTSKDNNIKEIKRIIDRCCGGETSIEYIVDGVAPFIHSTINDSVLIEQFSTNGVTAVTYRNEIKISEEELTYEELDEDIIEEILELMEKEETEYDTIWESQ